MDAMNATSSTSNSSATAASIAALAATPLDIEVTITVSQRMRELAVTEVKGGELGGRISPAGDIQSASKIAGVMRGDGAARAADVGLVANFTVTELRSREELQEFRAEVLDSSEIKRVTGFRFLLLNRGVLSGEIDQKMIPIVSLRKDGLYFSFSKDDQGYGESVGKSLIDMFGGEYSAMSMRKIDDQTIFVVEKGMRILQLLLVLGLKKDEVQSLCDNPVEGIVKKLLMLNELTDWDETMITAYIEKLCKSFPAMKSVTPLPPVKYRQFSEEELTTGLPWLVYMKRIGEWMELCSLNDKNPFIVDKSSLDIQAVYSKVPQNPGLIIKEFGEEGPMLRNELANHPAWNLETSSEGKPILYMPHRASVTNFSLHCGLHIDLILEVLK